MRPARTPSRRPLPHGSGGPRSPAHEERETVVTIAPADPVSEATAPNGPGGPAGDLPGTALLRILTELTADLPDTDPGRVAAAALRGRNAGSDTAELRELATEAAAGLIAEDPQYSRLAARLLTLAGPCDRTTVSILVLVARLIALVETITQIRLLQQRQAQAEAARRTRQHLDHAAAGHQPSRRPDDAVLPTPVRLAMAGFPNPWAPMIPQTPASPAPSMPPRQASRRRGP